MKKIVLILIIVLGVCANMYSQGKASNCEQATGLFGRGVVSDEVFYGAGITRKGLQGNGTLPGLPTHNLHGDQPAPIGSGIAILTLFGVAYLVGKRRED